MYINYIQFYRIHSNHVHRKQDRVREDYDYREVFQIYIIFDIDVSYSYLETSLLY